MKHILRYLTICLFFSITACSSLSDITENRDPKIFPPPSGNGPVAPAPSEPGLVIPGPGPAIEEHVNIQENAPLPSPGDKPSITLMSMSGSVLTVWSRHKNSWLWGYTPWDSNSFGSLRNWKIEPGKTPGTVRFMNEVTSTCITYGVSVIGIGGFIHTPCNYKSNNFDFQLIPTLNGNVFIKSVAINRCIRTRFLDRTSASPYAFEILPAECPKAGEENIELQWSVSEPLKPALAAIAKPQLRPLPPLPVIQDHNSSSDQN